MQNTFLYVLLLVVFSSTLSFAQEITFHEGELEDNVYDYGTLVQYEKSRRVLKFKNTGDVPLVIMNLKGSCGCLGYGYKKEPIEPGKEGEIWFTYDTKRVGYFTKHLTLQSNDINGEITVIRLKGTVVEALKNESEKTEETAEKTN